MATLMERYGLTGLNAAEQTDLARELVPSLAIRAAILTEAHWDDLDRRLEEYKDNPLAGSPWHEVKARLRRAGP